MLCLATVCGRLKPSYASRGPRLSTGLGCNPKEQKGNSLANELLENRLVASRSPSLSVFRDVHAAECMLGLRATAKSISDDIQPLL